MNAVTESKSPLLFWAPQHTQLQAGGGTRRQAGDAGQNRGLTHKGGVSFGNFEPLALRAQKHFWRGKLKTPFPKITSYLLGLPALYC